MIVEFVIFTSLLIILLFKFNQKPKGLPPGEWGYPVLGTLPVGGNNLFRDVLTHHKQKYGGGIFCTKIASKTGVFITDYKIAKEAYQKMEMSIRPSFHTIELFGEDLGISMASGLVWRTNRRFSVKVLRDYGLGKSRMEQIIEREVGFLVEHFNTKVGQPVELSWSINVAVVNILWSIVSDRRYDLEDPEIYKFTDMNHENFNLLQSRLLLMDYYPFLTYLPMIIQDNLLNSGALRRNRQDFKAYLMKIINEHIENLDKENPKNFIDMYLTDISKDTDPDMDFRKNLTNLCHILINFFTGGSDSVSSSIRWLINFMAMHQDWQQKVQKQIDENIPRERFATYGDKEKLPILEACMSESLRKGSVFPLGLPHGTLEDTTLEGFHIPAGSVIISCLKEMHHDPAYWERPNVFYPEHFLNKDGTYNSRKENFAPFSIGKRICPGEHLAKADVFMFGAAILQRFNVKPAPGEVITYDDDKTSTFVNYPRLYKFMLEKRY